MNGRIPLRFFIVTFLWSWIIWTPLALAAQGAFQLDEEIRAFMTMPALVLGAFGPVVGTCFSIWTLEGRPALGNFLRRFLSLRFGWKVWASMFLILGSLNVIAWYLPELFGQERLPMLLPGVYVFPVWVLLMVFLGGGQEEVGWRGYILEPLEARYGLWGGNIILGLVWTCWHIPLWFVPGTSQVYMPFMAFAIGAIGLSFFFSWLVKASGGKLLSGLVAHGLYNAFIPLFPTLVMESDALQTRWWIHQGLILVVGILFMLRLTSLSRSRDPGVAQIALVDSQSS